MAAYEAGERYRLRALIAFAIKDIEAYPTEEEALRGFDKWLSFFKKKKRPNPYMLFLVDFETEQVIKEYTETPDFWDDGTPKA